MNRAIITLIALLHVSSFRFAPLELPADMDSISTLDELLEDSEEDADEEEGEKRPSLLDKLNEGVGRLSGKLDELMGGNNPFDTGDSETKGGGEGGGEGSGEGSGEPPPSSPPGDQQAGDNTVPAEGEAAAPSAPAPKVK